MAAMRGALSETTVAGLCREMADRQATGVVELHGGRGPGELVFRDGHVTWASSPTPRARLGDRLVNARLLDEEHLAEVLEEQGQTPGHVKLGALLVQRGLVGRDAVRVFVQEQILDAVLDLVHWDASEHTWRDDAPPPDEVAVAFAVDDLLVEVSRRQQEWDQVSRLIPDLGMVPEFVTGASSAAASLEPDEFAMLASIDGRRDVRQLADDLGYGEFEAARLVYGLVLLGVVHIGTPSPTDAEVDTVEAEAPTDDAPADEASADEEVGDGAEQPPAFVAWDDVSGTSRGDADDEDEDELGPTPWVVADVDSAPDDLGDDDLADWILDSADESTPAAEAPAPAADASGPADDDVDVGAALEDALFGDAVEHTEPREAPPTPPTDDVGTILGEVGRDDPGTGDADTQPPTEVSEFLRELSRLALDDDPDDQPPSPPETTSGSESAGSARSTRSANDRGARTDKDDDQGSQRGRWRLFGKRDR